MHQHNNIVSTNRSLYNIGWAELRTTSIKKTHLTRGGLFFDWDPLWRRLHWKDRRRLFLMSFYSCFKNCRLFAAAARLLTYDSILLHFTSRWIPSSFSLFSSFRLLPVLPVHVTSASAILSRLPLRSSFIQLPVEKPARNLSDTQFEARLRSLVQTSITIDKSIRRKIPKASRHNYVHVCSCTCL